MPTPDRIRDLIAAYAAGPRMLEEAIAGIPEDERRFSPGAPHWSIHENIIHIADTELVGATRMRFVLAEPEATLVPFDQERWAEALDYASHPVDEALAMFRSIRCATTDMLRRTPADTWTRAGVHTELGPQTLEWLVEHFAEHVPYHLRTIAKRRTQYAQARKVPNAR